jgi:hypothetical protein
MPVLVDQRQQLAGVDGGVEGGGLGLDGSSAAAPHGAP